MKKTQFVYSGCENLEAMTEAANYNNYLISLILKHTKKGDKVLDFGAGSGTYTDILKDRGLTADCLEPDEKLAKILKSKGYTVLKNDGQLKAKSYDLIYALNVFEHLEDDFKIMSNLEKALKPGGRILIYVPAFDALYTAMDDLVGHYRRYKVSRLRSLAKKSGLKVHRLEYCDPMGFGAALVYKYVGNKEGTITPRSVKAYDRLIFPISRAFHPVTKKAFGKNALLVAEKS